MESPVSNLEAEERSLEPWVWAGSVGLLASFREVPGGLLRSAIRTGRVSPVTGSEHWRSALIEASDGLGGALLPIVRQGAGLGIEDVPGFSPGDRVLQARLRQLAWERADDLVTDLDRKTRANLRRMVRNASRRYQRDPSRAFLRELEEEVRSGVGLTTAQARRVLAVEGDQQQERIEGRLLQRASAVAAFGAIGAVNFGRLLAWRLAQENGALGGAARKRWRSVRDGKTRRRHREQAEMGAVLLSEPYPIFGVMAPPAPEAGCRCWHVLVR